MTTQPRKGFARVEPVKPQARVIQPEIPEEESASLPTMEQLENLTAALGFPLLPEGMRPPYYQESLLNLHAIVQAAALGDEAAGEKLAALRRLFARQ